MSTENNIKTACQNANHVCDKVQYREANLIEKIKLIIHLIYCRACRKYTNNNQKLTKVLKGSNVKCMNSREKEAMKVKLTRAIKKQQN